MKNPSHAPSHKAHSRRYIDGMKRNSSVARQPSSVAAGQIHTYAQLQRQIHHDLRVQHPEWVKSNGDSPMCDRYERRLAELIAFFETRHTNSIAA